jgi:hypothetical protein
MFPPWILNQQLKKSEWAPVGLHWSSDDHGPWWNSAQGDKGKSIFSPPANLGLDGHPRPCGAALHMFDGMPVATRGGGARFRHRFLIAGGQTFTRVTPFHLAG